MCIPVLLILFYLGNATGLRWLNNGEEKIVHVGATVSHVCLVWNFILLLSMVCHVGNHQHVSLGGSLKQPVEYPQNNKQM
mgnify:CR=1 FL=1